MIDEQVRLSNKQFMDAVSGSPDGYIEKAAAFGTKVTRRKLREDAFSPAIIPHEEVSNDDLDYFVDSEAPAIICEMEPDQFGAVSVAMNDTSKNITFFGVKYMLYFYTNQTPVWYKNINFLRTYRGDLRSIITDNSLRDLSRKKDEKFMRGVNEIVGIADGGLSPITGHQQNIVYPGGLSRDNMVNSLNLLKTHQLLNGVFLCNSVTFSQILKWGRNEMGGDFSQELAKKGTAAFEKASFMGVDFIVTMKSDLVPNGVFYEFTTPNYLGRAGVLQQPTMYVRKDHDMLYFDCREMLGVAIANANGVFKVKFNDIASSTGGDGRLPVPTAA